MHIIVAGLTALMICSSVMIGTPVAKAASVEEMQTQMAVLMSQIAALQSRINVAQVNGSSTPETPKRPMDRATSSTVLQIGAKVITTNALRIRSTAGLQATFIATQPAHVEGVIVEGPVMVDGYRWFKVDYVTGADGWNVGFLLKTKTQNEAGAWAHPPRLGLDGKSGSSSEWETKIAYLRAKLASTPEGEQRREFTAMLARLLGQQSSSTEISKPKVHELFEVMRKPHASTTSEFHPRPRASSTTERTEPASTESTSTSSGKVLGASTDIYAEIAQTLTNISATLSTIQ